MSDRFIVEEWVQYERDVIMTGYNKPTKWAIQFMQYLLEGGSYEHKLTHSRRCEVIAYLKNILGEELHRD